MARYSPAEIDDIKARNPVHEIAGALVSLRPQRRAAMTHVGSCPLCSPDSRSRNAARFECNAETWVCAVCQDGGDSIKLVALLNNLDVKKDFVAIVDRLGGKRPVDEAEAAKRSTIAADKRARQERANALYRERERKRLYENFWQPAAPWQGTPVETYLRGRGLEVPPGAKLRYYSAMPLFADGSEREPRLLHRGPAMLAPIMAPADGGIFRFSGLHITWLNERGPKGKLALVDPETGAAVPSKKIRGHKAGGFIDLGGHVRQYPDPRVGEGMVALPFYRQASGEGIESTLAVYTAMARARHDVRGIAWRCGIDLGNLAGKALDRLPHPTLKDAAGRTRRVPGIEPDMESDAMPVLSTVRELILLGDSDSDPFTTRCAMARAAKRHERAILRSETTNGAPPGAAELLASAADLSCAPPSPAAGVSENFSCDGRRIVRVIWPRPGTDFNSMLQGDQ